MPLPATTAPQDAVARRSSTTIEYCPTCRLNWNISPPVKCDGDNDCFMCVGCDSIYTAPMLAAPKMLERLKRIVAADDEFRASLPSDFDGDPLTDECDLARTIIASATGALS